MMILNDMGIQPWRLRRSADQINADSGKDNAVGDKVDKVEEPNPKAIVALAAPEKTSPLKNGEPERRIWPDKKSKETTLDQASVPTESNKIGDINTPESKSSSSSLPQTSVVKSMPAPMPAPVSSAYSGVIPTPAPLPLSEASSFSDEPPINSYEEAGYHEINAEPINNEIGSPDLGSLPNLDWNELQSLVDGWQHCPTCGDGKSVLGHGDINADWLFVSDAPTSLEVEQKSLFSGRSGPLFEAMLSALGLERETVYTTSLFKCVATDDMSVIPACDTILQRQIELVKPKVIVAFGEFTAQTILKANANLDVLRTQDQRCIVSKKVIIPTFTPAQMLDDSRLKSKVWADLKKAVLIANMPS